MLNGPLSVYKDYHIVPEPILLDSVTNAIEFYSKDFSISSPHVWAHEDIF